MDILLTLLILTSFILLIIGIFSPKTSLFWDKKNVLTRKRSAIIYGSILFVSFILLGATADDIKSNDKLNSVSSPKADKKDKREEKKEAELALTQYQLDSIAVEAALLVINEREAQTITARDLTASYEANEVLADENFKGKTFFVEGKVTDIKKDILDDIYVTLEGDGMFRQVQCFFDDKATASQLRKGMKVTFKGKCDGLMMNVLMKNCELVENLSDLKKNK